MHGHGMGMGMDMDRRRTKTLDMATTDSACFGSVRSTWGRFGGFVNAGEQVRNKLGVLSADLVVVVVVVVVVLLLLYIIDGGIGVEIELGIGLTAMDSSRVASGAAHSMDILEITPITVGGVSVSIDPKVNITSIMSNF